MIKLSVTTYCSYPHWMLFCISLAHKINKGYLSEHILAITFIAKRIKRRYFKYDFCRSHLLLSFLLTAHL